MNDKVKINVRELINALEYTSIDPLDIDCLIELDNPFNLWYSIGTMKRGDCS